jgi:hypothetical protein
MALHLTLLVASAVIGVAWLLILTYVDKDK